MELRYSGDGYFYLVSKYEERNIPKEYGFKWNSYRSQWEINEDKFNIVENLLKDYPDLVNESVINAINRRKNYFDVVKKRIENGEADLSEILSVTKNRVAGVNMNAIVVYLEYGDDAKDDLKSFNFTWNSNGKYWFKNIQDFTIDTMNNFIDYIKNNEFKIDKNLFDVYNKFVAERKKAVDESYKAKSDIVIPAPEGLDYFPFQKAGVEYLLNKDGRAIIADEMGLGKTIQAIGFLNVKNEYPALIICPNSLKLNWEKEIKKWIVKKDIKVKLISTKDKENLDTTYDIYIINYDIVSKMLEDLLKIKFNTIIIDEAHYIKNYKAQRTKVISSNFKYVKNKILLSGTPLTNRPIELYPLLNFISEDKINFMSFAKRYADAYKDRYGWRMDGASNLDELNEKLRAKYMIRRRKEDVLKELPEKIRTIIPISADSSIKSLEKGIKKIIEDIENAKKEVKEMKKKLKEIEDEQEKEKIREQIKMFQANNITSKVKIAFTEIEKYRIAVAKKKVPIIAEYINSQLEEDEEKKFIVFVYHKEILDMYKEIFSNNGVFVSGDTPINERQKAVDAFQNDPNIRLFFGTIRAISEGVTLTASSNVIFAEYDWTPAKMIQAEDRAHRIGQKNTVNVYWFAYENSIDMTFIEKIVEKMKITKEVLDNEIMSDEDMFANIVSED